MTETITEAPPKTDPHPGAKCWKCECGNVLGYKVRVNRRALLLLLTEAGPQFVPEAEAFCNRCGKRNKFHRDRTTENAEERRYTGMERRYRGNRP